MMARNTQFEPLYTAFQGFVQNCLLSDRSILWPEKRIWTRENVGEVRTRFVDAILPDHSLSFEEKMIRQLQGSPNELWALLADVYYVYFLPSSYITLGKKLSDIQWAAEQGGFTPPPSGDPIWDPLKTGCTRTGQRYHQKHMQFRLILLFAQRVKESDNPRSFFEDPYRMQNVLDEILESIPKTDRAYGMRHALLHLAYPERYERIISTRDKKAILNTYSQQIQQSLPDDLDEALYVIREELSPKFNIGEEPFNYYSDLKTEWKPDSVIVPPDDESSGETPIWTRPENDDIDLSRVIAVLSHTKNVILYGPPGTGKTYVANKAAEALVAPQLEKGLTESAAMLRAISDLTFYEILALSMYLHGPEKTYSVPELGTHKLVQLRFGIAPVKHPNNQIWGYLQAHTDLNSVTVNYSGKTTPYLFDKDQSSRWRLIDSGRQFVKENLAARLESLQSGKSVESKLEDFVRWATFHQSYAYEDFVEGLRPTLSEEAQENISYEITPGIFREICALASQDKEDKYVLIIDEINRGNIAKILGELITLIEDDKRGNLFVTLPYSKERFSVPENLYIIATMNTADRSIALMDVALRRRFTFIEMMPRPDLLKGIVIESESPSVELDKLLANLNKEITQQLDRDHQIGHSYFMKIASSDADRRIEQLEFVWNYQIIPLLEEYFYSQPDKLRQILSPFVTSIEAGIDSVDGSEPVGRAQGEDLIDSLGRLAGKS